MKKIYTTLLMVAFLFSCSTDEQKIDTEEPMETDFVTRVNQGEFDNSNLGLYKGIFTTNDASTRATVRIENNGDDIPVAILTTPDGSTFELTASEKITNSKSSDEKTNNTENTVTFASSEGSFDFSVDQNGENIIIENVTFQGSDAEILMAKQTSKQPVETVTGTYYCVDCDPSHPELGDGEDDDLQTFNFMFTGTGEDATVQTQATLNNRTYGPGLAVQYNCGTDGDYTSCTLSGALEDEDGNVDEENLSFFGNSGPVYLTGIHTYNNQEAGTECSSVSGLFTYESTRYGTSVLTFQSDEAIGCEVPGFETVIFENFEDPENNYVMTSNASDEPLTDDLNLLDQNSYYGVFMGDSDPQNVSYNGSLDDGYFGAQNTSDAETGVNTLYLTWEDIDISDRSLLELSLFFATDDENPEGDWDQSAEVGVEYSFDDGATWQPIVGVAAGPGEPDEDRQNDFVYEDVNQDGLGDIAGVLIEDTFTQLRMQLETDGNNSIDVRIYIGDLNNDQEDIALDNFLVTGR